MKASQYNFIYPYEEGKRVMYNSRSNALALIDEEKYEQFLNYCEAAIKIEDEDLEESLRSGAYLIDDDINELDLIRFHMLEARYSMSSLGLTLSPTSDCNFRCTYCYEKDSIKPVTMTQEVQDKIVEFVENRAQNLSYLSVAWYGGEPLLALDIIEVLTEKFKNICKKHGINYSHSMITNGYLLTTKVVERLRPLELSMMQITLDGPPEDHDKRRFLKGSQPTFSKIIDNLKASKDNMPFSISLRINVDRSNVEKVDRLLDILRENNLQRTVIPYLGMVENHEDIYSQGLCYPTSEFSLVDFEFNKKYNNDTNKYLLGMYPRLVSNLCCADSSSGLVINADGKIYRCWCDIGIEDRCVGDIVTGGSKNLNTYLNYMMYDPTYDIECKQCKYLPVCMGGCPSRRMYRKDNRCNMVKYRLDEFMKIAPQELKRQKTLLDNEALAVI